jgi:hypothetical protein
MPTGLVSAYDLTVGTKVNMDEAIYVLSPIDSPMISGLDSDGLSVIGSAPVDQIRFDWMDEEILTPRSTLGGALTAGDAFLQLSSASERLKFSTGDVVRVMKAGATEVIRVTGYSITTASILLVTRGYDGTAATTYAGTETVVGLGTALAEGSDPEAARSADRATTYNMTQIFGPTLIHMSSTEQVISKYGINNEFAHQTMRRTQENVISREQAYVYGRRSDSVTTEIRTTGGLDYFITTNVNATSTQLTEANISVQQQSGFNRGGVADRLMANPKSLADLNDVANTSRVRQEVTDWKRGRMPVMEFQGEFGIVTIVRNRWVHPLHAFLFSRENVTRRVLRPLILERLAKTGDSDKAQIVCEEGLEVKGEEHMSKFTNLTAYPDT